MSSFMYVGQLSLDSLPIGEDHSNKVMDDERTRALGGCVNLDPPPMPCIGIESWHLWVPSGSVGCVSCPLGHV